MLKLPVMKDPVQGIFTVEFIGLCHIDADIGRIPANSGPDFSAAFAEGDGRAPTISQEEMGSAERAADHVNWERSPIERMPAFPERTFRRHNVIQQDGNQAILISSLVRIASFENLAVNGQGCIKCRSSSMRKIHGMNIEAHPETQCIRMPLTCMMVWP
jgi:hypothetical protein